MSANINDICMGIRKPSRVRCLAGIFFSAICIPTASTLAKKPAKPQSQKQRIRWGYRCKIK